VTRIDPGRVEDLILARLAVRSAVAPKARDVSRALYGIVARQLTKREWEATFERALAALRAAGFVAAPGSGRSRAGQAKRRGAKTTKGRAAKPSKGSSASTRAGKSAAGEALSMTRAGQKRLQAVLGAKSRVVAKDWPELERRYLSGVLFPGTPLGKKAPELSALILGQRLGVPAGSAQTREQVLDTWLRKSLGLGPGRKLELDDVRTALLARELGLPQRRSLKLKDVLGLAAVQLSGAASGADNDVSAALLLRWLSQPQPPAKSHPQPTPEPPTPVERIAAKALRAAEGPDARQFGPNKVFIGSVWRALAADPELAELDEAAFKRQLVEAHRRGLVILSRADLVAAMDPSEVAASEITHQNATYHFISRGASA
jgi:hypothetical protein